MLRFSCFVVAAVSLLATTAPVTAQSSFSEYRRALQNSRRESLDAYQQWQQDRLRRYPPAHGSVPGRQGIALDLPRADVPAGSYNVQLPGGLNFRVNVGEGRRAGGWVDGNYVDLAKLTDQLEERVRDLQLVLTRQGQLQPWQNEILLSREALQALTEAIEDHDDPQRVHILYERFDELWHPLAHELLHEYGEGSAVGQHVALANQLDDSLHQVLKIAPASVYDGVQLAALTWQLDDTTSRLQEEMDAEGRRQRDRLGRQADRVHRHAHALHDVVSQGAAFSVVQDEYTQFDEAWHRLADQTQRLAIENPRLRRLLREVWQIDQTLHQELFIEPPIVGTYQRTVHLAEHIARSADFLATELTWEIRKPDSQEVADAAANLAQAARNLHDQLARHQTPATARREIRLVRDWWRYLDDQMRDLDRRRFREAFAIAAQIDDQMHRLEESLR